MKLKTCTYTHREWEKREEVEATKCTLIEHCNGNWQIVVGTDTQPTNQTVSAIQYPACYTIDGHKLIVGVMMRDE